jgi:thiamine biosynthesis lipoprotein
MDEGVKCGLLGGWVNAGGDARVFGELKLPLQVRHPLKASRLVDLGAISSAAVATSVLDGFTSQTVIAPTCMVADALTKIVFKTGNAQHPLLTHYSATAHIIS